MNGLMKATHGQAGQLGNRPDVSWVVNRIPIENDVFTIEGIKYVANTVRIFNRWGQIVYEASNYKNTWKADGIPDGTYYYEVTVHRVDEPFTGHLTILRNGW